MTPVSQFHPVTREAAAGLPLHTLYRPADLDAWGSATLPLVVYGNGACQNSNHGGIAMLTLVAAHGFAVVAVGAPEAPTLPDLNTAHPGQLIQALDWAADDRGRGQMGGRVDVTRIAAMGQSCGGLEALVAAADPRVATTVALNTGFFATTPGEPPRLGYGREHLRNVHGPVLFVSGGPSDQAYVNTQANVELLDVPVVWADNPHGGHSGLWKGYRDDRSDPTIMNEAITVVVSWLEFVLNGDQYARSYFLGRPPGLAGVPGWAVTSRNFT